MHIIESEHLIEFISDQYQFHLAYVHMQNIFCMHRALSGLTYQAHFVLSRLQSCTASHYTKKKLNMFEKNCVGQNSQS